MTYAYGALGGTYATQIVQKGEAATRPDDPKANGFDFLGWYTEEGCPAGSEYDFGKTVTADMTLYAKWGGTSYNAVITDEKGGQFGGGQCAHALVLRHIQPRGYFRPAEWEDRDE